MTTELRWGAATDVGLVRTINQDRMLCEFPVFMVADGMGGHTAGEVAAQLAVDTMRAELQNVSPVLRQDVANAVMTANHLILTEAEIHPDYRGMGTTITGICVTSDPDTGDEQLTIVNVGDSRTYVLRMGELIQLTKDDSVVGEMIRLGLIDESEAETHAKRHMVTRALGVAEDLVVSTDIVVPLQGERFLICSDGLLREVPHNQVAGVLRRINDPAEAAKELVTMAVAKGGSDNTTVVIVDVANDGGRAQRASGSVPTPLTGYGADLDAVTVDAENELRASTVLANTTTPAAPTRKTAKPLVTWRVVALIVALLVLLAGAYLGLGWYATSGAVITVDRQGEAPEQQLLVVSKGRQGGVLWWDPQVVSRTGVSLAQLRPEDRQQFLNGRQVASVETATQLIANLQISAGSR